MTEKIKLSTGSMRNQCPACRELFNSVAAFDKHRYGQFGIEDKSHEGTFLLSNRKCRTIEQMEAKGMVKTNSGFWASKAYDYPSDDVGVG
jgi:hypothetical protein